MRWLYHIRLGSGSALPERYAPDSLAEEGFLHASFQGDVAESARLYFPRGCRALRAADRSAPARRARRPRRDAARADAPRARRGAARRRRRGAAARGDRRRARSRDGDSVRLRGLRRDDAARSRRHPRSALAPRVDGLRRDLDVLHRRRHGLVRVGAGRGGDHRRGGAPAARRLRRARRPRRLTGRARWRATPR